MTWTLFGRETRNPLAIVVIIVLCLVLLLPTLPFHLIGWLFNGRGFIKERLWKSTYEPGAFWTIASNVVFYGLVLALVIL